MCVSWITTLTLDNQNLTSKTITFEIRYSFNYTLDYSNGHFNFQKLYTPSVKIFWSLCRSSLCWLSTPFPLLLYPLLWWHLQTTFPRLLCQNGKHWQKIRENTFPWAFDTSNLSNGTSAASEAQNSWDLAVRTADCAAMVLQWWNSSSHHSWLEALAALTSTTSVEQ